MECYLAKEKIAPKFDDKCRCQGNVRSKTKNVFLKQRNVVSHHEKNGATGFTKKILAKRHQCLFTATTTITAKK